MTADFLLTELLSVADPLKAQSLQRFFKTAPGQYAHNDQFLGIPVPLLRNIAKHNARTPLPQLRTLIANPWHEARLCALLILIQQFNAATPTKQRQLFRFYLRNTKHINNWDLVDLSCPHIIGQFLLNNNRTILHQLANSPSLWEQRIAIVSTLTLIRNNQFTDTFAIAQTLFHHPHDLIRKAIGWMLREVGKRHRQTLSRFLQHNSHKMAPITLRYATKHFPQHLRQHLLHSTQH